MGFCLNVDDPTLPDCAPTADVVAATVKTRPFNAAVQQAAAALEKSLPVNDAACAFSDGFTVPIKITRKGKRPGKGNLRVTAELATGQRDRDRVRLVCEPAP